MSVRNTYQLMLRRDIMVVNMRKHMKRTNTPCGQNAEHLNVKESGIYSYHCALNCYGYVDRKLYVTRNDGI